MLEKQVSFQNYMTELYIVCGAYTRSLIFGEICLVLQLMTCDHVPCTTPSPASTNKVHQNKYHSCVNNLYQINVFTLKGEDVSLYSLVLSSYFKSGGSCIILLFWCLNLYPSYIFIKFKRIHICVWIHGIYLYPYWDTFEKYMNPQIHQMDTL